MAASAVLRVWPAAWPHSTRMVRNQRLPWRALVRRRLPALSWLPGAIPAQLARCALPHNQQIKHIMCYKAPNLEGRAMGVEWQCWVLSRFRGYAVLLEQNANVTWPK